MTNNLRTPDRLERLCFWIFKISNGLFGAFLLLGVGVVTYNVVTTPNIGDVIASIGVALLILTIYAGLFLANLFLKIDTRYRLLFRANSVGLGIFILLSLLVIIFARSSLQSDGWWVPILFAWPALNLVLLKVIRRRNQSQVQETFA